MKKSNLITTLCLGSTVLLAGFCTVSANDYTKGVKLGEYKGLTVERVVSEVSDDMVEYTIQEELEAYAEFLEITDRPAQEGDTVYIDFVGYMDGKEIENGSETDCEVLIGAGDFIDGFEEGIIGMNIGETKEVTAHFPEEYDGEFDGKDAVFKITLNTITVTEMPEFDDAFIKENTIYSTMEEYKAATKDQLQIEADQESTYMAAYEAFSQVVDHSEVKDYPQDLLDAAVDQIIADGMMFAEQFGMSFDDLYGEDYTPEEEAKNILKEKMVLYTIAEKEKIEVSDEEYEDFASDNWIMYGYESREAFDEEYPKDEVMYQLLYEKVINFLSSQCKFTDISEEEYYGRFDDSEFEEDGMLYEDDDLSDYPELFDTLDLPDGLEELDLGDLEIEDEEE